MPEFNELNRIQSNDLSISANNDQDERNLSSQSLVGDDEFNSSDGSSNTLDDSSIDTTPQSSRVFDSIENKIVKDKLKSNTMPIDNRLTTSRVSSFKTTSTPVIKSTIKSEIKISSDEQTGLPFVFISFYSS